VVQAPALVALIVAVLLTAASPAAAAGAGPTRYSLAGGCYALRSADSGKTGAGAGRIRMQATGLGRYLLYRPDRSFLAASGAKVAPASTPTAAAVWIVRGERGGPFTLSPSSRHASALAVGRDGALRLAKRGSAASPIAFAHARKCPRYPEAQLGARGKPSRGKTPYGRVGGLLEGHMHWMTFEYFGGDFHCGRPWHPYGIPYALPDCSAIEGPQGSAAPFQNFLNFGAPESPHDTTGWPKLTAWGAHNLTYEGTYWRWIQRAWMGGLRLMVMSVNENRVLCELQQRRKHGCDEMATVRRGYRDIRRLQRYVDAQAGGPGKGFFRIVTNPFQARRVINKGKMAVVLEIEVSELFGCRGLRDNSSCDKAQIDSQLNKYYRMGMRSSLLLNKFDNPLTGVRFDSGAIGGLINAGNKQSSGSFWSAKTCTGRLHDNTIQSFTPGDPVATTILGLGGIPGGTFPTYPNPPHCNTRGLTDLGRYLERRMMQKHMIINPDHMSQAGVGATLDLAEKHHYSGVISPHGWMDPGNWPRIWKLGGLAFPDSNTSGDYIQAYRTYRPKRTPYLLGWGYGADLGGLAAQPDAPNGNSHAISYPFKSYDGKVTFRRQRTGQRTFDYNKEGVAQYGLYADWFNDVQRHGGKRMARDMWNGAEAYLEMWERAKGIRSAGCRSPHARLTTRGIGPVRLGESWVTLLRRAGQPQQRTRAWSWCVRGAGNRNAAVVAEMSPSGRVELVGTTERGSIAGLSRSTGAPYVYGRRGGHVRVVAVASRSLGQNPAALRAAMRRVVGAHVTQASRTYVPSTHARAAHLTGTNLAGSSDPRLNRALLLLCHLNR
jgi:hypothetical protein